MAANSLFPLLLYLLFSLFSSPSLSLSISPPSTNATYGYSSLSFPSFNPAFANTNLTLLGSASISFNGALQITPDSLNQGDLLANKAGRIFLTSPFTLWENTSSGVRLASFSTAFDINIFRTNLSKPGEGFAFLIASSLEGPPPGSEDGYLGLTNYTLNGKPSNKFVAVELDTVKQSYDPDENHVGLDINRVNSTIWSSLAPLGIEISPVNGTNYTLWVDYNGSARHISVYMDLQGKSKPAKPVLDSSLDLSTVIDKVAYIGFSASTGTRFELNCVLAWELMVERLREEKAGLSKTAIALIIGLSCSISAIVALILLAFYIRRKRVRDDPTSLTATALKSLPGMPREFDFKELKKATNNFDEKMMLGQGGFGVVYKGVLVGDNGEEMVVAVKQFSRANTKGQDDFLQELMIINRLRHKHLVRLVGWCHNCGGLLLVYDFMPNGSLDQHLFYPDKPILNWDRRYNIVAGVASALHYLHNEYDQMVVHRDLKASNVMLDSAFHARLGDFGLARALETDKTSYAELSGIQGTMGYIAPECFHTGKATRESDIFAFGATILETVCCRRPRSEISGFHFLVDWVWKLYREGRILEAVDARLEGNFDEADVDRLLRLGLMCSHPTPCERPKTQAIVQILSRSVPPPDVPPFKPAFVMPAAEPESDSSTLHSMGVTSSYTVSISDGWTHSSNYASKEHLENDGSVV